jgi:uncharacterized protein YdbL (DUF1318 family)
MNKRIFSTILSIFIIILPLISFALSLQEAKSGGLVGEKPDGYIGAVVSSDEVSQLVSHVNQKRREEYQRLSSGNGTPLNVIEELAGAKLISQLSSGEYYMDHGQWLKK